MKKLASILTLICLTIPVALASEVTDKIDTLLQQATELTMGLEELRDMVVEPPPPPSPPPPPPQTPTYYVSPNGLDSNPGTVEAPWQTITHGISQLFPGDTLLIRSGTYFEQIPININGTPDARITIQNYPDEYPMVTGTVPITGWVPCTPNDIDNPNYSSIYWTEFPATSISDPLTPTFFEAGEALPIAQQPDQTEPWIQNDKLYWPVPDEGGNYGQYTSIVDSIYLTQSNDYWNGSYVQVYQSANDRILARATIIDFDATTHKFTFSPPRDLPFRLGDCYTILNHPSILDKPGEYCYFPTGSGTYRLYLWPHDPANLSNKIRSAVLAQGFDVSVVAGNYVTLDGLEIWGYQNYGIEVRGQHTAFYTRNCKVHHIYGSGIYYVRGQDDIIENNTVYNVGTGIPILTGGGTDHPVNVIVRNNTIQKSGSSAIYFSGVRGGQIIDNYVGEPLGTHNSGITVYGYAANGWFSQDILVTRNTAPYCRMRAVKDVTVYNNIFANEVGYSPIAHWQAESAGEITILNNVLLAPTGLGIYGSFTDTQLDKLTIQNNILSCISQGAEDKADRDHNLYTTTSLPKQLGKGSFCETDLSAIFLNPTNDDYRLAPNSPAIDAGGDISDYMTIMNESFPGFDANRDIAGNPRVRKPRIDIGPYESE